MSRKSTGVLFGLLTFLALVALALISTWSGRFVSGLPGIETDLTEKAEGRLASLGVVGEVEADGRDLSVSVGRSLPPGTNLSAVADALLEEPGVRSVTFADSGDAFEVLDLETEDPDESAARSDASGGSVAADEETDGTERELVDETQMVFAFGGGEGTLSGVVPNERDREALSGAVPASLGVTADLVVDPNRVTTDDHDDRIAVLADLIGAMGSQFDTGQLAVNDGVISMFGEAASDEAAEAARAEIESITDAAGLEAQLQIRVVETGPSESDVAAVEAVDLGAVAFEPGSAELTTEGRSAVEAAAEQLTGVSGVAFDIVGHTNSADDPDANLLLSQLRADAVRSELEALGVDVSQTSSIGVGSSAPIDGPDAGSDPVNDRVELILTEGN